MSPNTSVTRTKRIAITALALLACFGVLSIPFHKLLPSQAYSVSYGIGSVSYTDGALFRPWDVRIAKQFMSGHLFCVRVPQWQLPWGQWLVVDFERQMFYVPNGPPDRDGLNQYFGVALPDEKIGAGWRVDFSGGRALCYAPTGEWCLLTPLP